MSTRIPYIPVLIHRGNLWFSELAVAVLMALIMSVLVVLVSVVMTNENRIRNNSDAIETLRAAGIVSEHRLSVLREKHVISATLRRFVRGRLPESTLYLLTELVYRNSRRFGYDPFLVLAVIHVESFFDADALGRFRSGRFSGALGLMQLKFETAREVAADLGIPTLHRDDLFVPEINIALGTAYLTRLIARFESLKLGILAYNQGPGTIMESLSGKRKLSIKYYNKVIRSYFKLKKLGENVETLEEEP
jgi:soluble lytic murein transglycosylase